MLFRDEGEKSSNIKGDLVTRFNFLLVNVFLFTCFLKAQEADRDSVKYPFSRPDTLKTMVIKSNLYWYDLQLKLHTAKDSSRYASFSAKDEKGLNYGDIGDIFSSQPLWYVYDLQERGRPLYISVINKFPHQTPFYYGGILMNDPIHGMFNGQFIPVNFIRYLETDLSIGAFNNSAWGSGNAISVVPLSLHTKAPWSRVVYKQDGAFGYRDLDLSFVKPFSETFAIQLGGINKGYNGSFYNSSYKGTNYRGEITWQYKPNLYLRSQFFLNRDLVGITPDPDIYRQEITFPRQKELRDDYFIDLTWQPFDSTGERLHLLIFNTFSSRKFKDRFSSYTILYKHRRYGMDVNYNIFLGKNELLFGTGTILPKVWGTGFTSARKPYSYNAYAHLTYPLSDKVTLSPAIQLVYRNDFDPQILPEIRIDILPLFNHKLSFMAARYVRLPNTSELFFNFDTLYGNADLHPELHNSIYGSYDISVKNKWHVCMQSGYFHIDREINWLAPHFVNSPSREFYFLGLNAEYNLGKFSLASGGQYTFSKLYLTPRSSAYGNIHFQDIWLKGAVKIDAYGFINAYDRHHVLYFESRLNRFYYGKDLINPFFTLNWKIVATVMDAKIFFEMDNVLSEDYEIIHGYMQRYRHLRFGVNWILWD
jgi:hypothetical protein